MSPIAQLCKWKKITLSGKWIITEYLAYADNVPITIRRAGPSQQLDHQMHVIPNFTRKMWMLKRYPWAGGGWLVKRHCWIGFLVKVKPSGSSTSMVYQTFQLCKISCLLRANQVKLGNVVCLIKDMHPGQSSILFLCHWDIRMYIGHTDENTLWASIVKMNPGIMSTN